MRTHSSWGYEHYLPLDRNTRPPYVTQLIPSEDGIRFRWSGADAAEAVLCVRDGGEVSRRAVCSASECRFDGLRCDTDYALTLTAENGTVTRLFRTGNYPGVMVNYLHPDDPAYDFSGRYLCSPCICRAPDGALLASCDLFAPNAPQNLQLIFRSADEGKSWEPLCEIFPCFWGSLFVHRGVLYLMGISDEYGDLLIGRSDDSGRTWSAPTVLFRGSSCSSEAGLHRAPMPVIEHAGRIWTEIDYGAWAKGRFANSLCSADADSDLLDPESWRCTGFLPYDRSWNAAEESFGGIEGNAVALPDGGIGALIRYLCNKALLLRGSTDDPEELLQFDSIVEMPFAHTKFEVRQLEDGRYLSVGNLAPDRRMLALSFSDDLKHWSEPRILIDGSDLVPEKDAYQYPAFIAEGNRLLILSRTARNGAHSFHDANCITFHEFTV